MKKSTLTIFLAIATGIALVLAFYLFYNKKPQEQLQSSEQNQHIEPPVEVETPVDFQGPKPSLVLFHADWCGACKGMMPAWEELKNKMVGGPINMVTFEHKTHGDIIKQNNIQAFPTIRLYPEGFPSQNFIDHAGERSAESLFNFAMSGKNSS
ncbi:thioredoxin domain-containing protein [bacterium]|nr:thioredoxin domain-containing protein [bacterium]